LGVEVWLVITESEAALIFARKSAQLFSSQRVCKIEIYIALNPCYEWSNPLYFEWELHRYETPIMGGLLTRLTEWNESVCSQNQWFSKF